MVGMKSNGLLGLIAFSKARKDILILLLEGSKSLAEIKENLHVSSPNILPRLKELLNKNLICKKNDRYSLTPIGISVINNFCMLTNTFQVIEKNEQFFRDHQINSLPQCFVDRIGMLGRCNVIGHRLENIGITHDILLENILKSKRLLWVTPILHEEYPLSILRLARQDIPVSLIFTKKIFHTFINDHYVDLSNILKQQNISLHVMGEDVNFFLIETDRQLLLSFAYTNGDFDYTNMLTSTDKTALAWGRELFKYYEKNSKNIILNDITSNKICEV